MIGYHEKIYWGIDGDIRDMWEVVREYPGFSEGISEVKEGNIRGLVKGQREDILSY